MYIYVCVCVFIYLFIHTYNTYILSNRKTKSHRLTYGLKSLGHQRLQDISGSDKMFCQIVQMAGDPILPCFHAVPSSFSKVSA